MKKEKFALLLTQTLNKIYQSDTLNLIDKNILMRAVDILALNEDISFWLNKVDTGEEIAEARTQEFELDGTKLSLVFEFNFMVEDMTLQEAINSLYELQEKAERLYEKYRNDKPLEDKSFALTYLSLEDLSEYLEKEDLKFVTENDLEYIASKMTDGLMESYWLSLKNLVDSYLKKEIETRKKK